MIINYLYRNSYEILYIQRSIQLVIITNNNDNNCNKNYDNNNNKIQLLFGHRNNKIINRNIMLIKNKK